MEENTQQQTQEKTKFNLGKFHDKAYKLLLLIPLVLFLLSTLIMINFYSKNHDFIYKDISLTGGTTITLTGNIDSAKLKQDLLTKLENIDTRDIYDLISNQKTATIIETKTDGETAKTVLENYLGYNLSDANSSFEFTGSTLSASFFKQLVIAVVEAFILMGGVVFLLFGQNKKTKFYVSALILLTLAIAYFSISFVHLFSMIGMYLCILFIFYLSRKDKKFLFPLVLLALSTLILFFPQVYSNNNLLIIPIIGVCLMVIYLIYSVPSFAVVLSAFGDIFMTLAVVDIIGIKISGAGIVAFLMLIGYSVDTDILLTNRVLKREVGSLNQKIFGAFKTGITMTLTSIFAIIAALITLGSLSLVLGQIFTILIIGLFFDIFNTWITNVCLIKWYVSKAK